MRCDRKGPLVAMVLAAVVALVAATPPAGAFLQRTTLKGTLGTDVGGVWLALYHVAPTFRVKIDRAADGVLPFSVGPVPEQLAPLAGKPPLGVVIKEFTNPGISAKYGIFEGDLVTKVNITVIKGQADYERALATVKKYALVLIRRPALGATRARLLKIKYSAREQEVDGRSVIADETVSLRAVHAVLPFKKELLARSRKHELWSPTEEDLLVLRTGWHKLPPPERATFVGGEYEVVSQAAYNAPQRKDEHLEDTLFAIIAKLKGHPLAGGGTNIGVYGVREVSTGRIAGSYVESTLASAPFPISIDFNGTFELLRLDDYSDKDLEYRKSRTVAEVKAKQSEVKLAPDVPVSE